MGTASVRVDIDAHVHLYPSYSIELALTSLFRNLEAWPGTRSDGGVCRIGLLTEARQCRVFREWMEGNRPAQYGAAEVVSGPEEGALTVRIGGAMAGYLIAGRQIVTRERLEVLALTVDADIADGTSTAETIAVVRAAGGIPVLSWAPGKWFLGRGRLVRQLLQNADAGALLVGDTSMRPVGWPLPCLMRLARRHGLGIVAGSDPLPSAGEEAFAGTYGIRWCGTFDAARPVTALRKILREQASELVPAGRRVGPVTFLRRWLGQGRLSPPR